MVLPSLTIGSHVPKTTGEYLNASQRLTHRDTPPHLLPEESTSHRPGVQDWEFRLVLSPRRFFYKKSGLFGDKMESIRNYESLSLSDLKYCLRVNKDAEYEDEDPDDIIARYLREFSIGPGKFSAKNKRNPYNRMVRSSTATARSSSTTTHAATRESITNGSRSVDIVRKSFTPIETPLPKHMPSSDNQFLTAVSESNVAYSGEPGQASIATSRHVGISRSGENVQRPVPVIPKRGVLRDAPLLIKQLHAPVSVQNQQQAERRLGGSKSDISMVKLAQGCTETLPTDQGPKGPDYSSSTIFIPSHGTE